STRPPPSGSPGSKGKTPTSTARSTKAGATSPAPTATRASRAKSRLSFETGFKTGRNLLRRVRRGRLLRLALRRVRRPGHVRRRVGHVRRLDRLARPRLGPRGRRLVEVQ